MLTRRRAVLFASLLLGGPTFGTSVPAVADGGARKVLVIPVVVGDPKEADLDVFDRARVLRSSDPGLFVPSEEATQRVEDPARADPPELDAREIDRWLRHGRDAMLSLARSDHERAAEALRKAQQVSERAAEALNRKPSMARRVLDTCLFLVRSLWETNQHHRAEARARKCRQLVPAIDPTTALHTPEVRALLQRIDRRGEDVPSMKLRVVSPQKGCLVRLNGLPLGRTPYERQALIPGEYRVQVECDPKSRSQVHRVLLQEDRVVRIDPTLDEAVHLSPELSLFYGSVEAFSKLIGRHAQTLLRDLGAEDAILVSAKQLLRVHAEVGLMGSVSFRPETDLGAEAKRLLEERISGRASAVRDEVTVDGLPKATPLRRARRIGGGALFGTGVAALGTSWGLYARRVRKGDAFASLRIGEPGFFGARNDWEDARLGFLVTASLGSVIAGTGFALAYAPRNKVPWWAWASGAIGAGLSVWGVVEMARAQTCPRDLQVTPLCVAGERRVDRGAVWLTTGPPLVFVPLWALARRRLVHLEASGTSLRLRGRF